MDKQLEDPVVWALIFAQACTLVRTRCELFESFQSLANAKISFGSFSLSSSK